MQHIALPTSTPPRALRLNGVREGVCLWGGLYVASMLVVSCQFIVSKALQQYFTKCTCTLPHCHWDRDPSMCIPLAQRKLDQACQVTVSFHVKYTIHCENFVQIIQQVVHLSACCYRCMLGALLL